MQPLPDPLARLLPVPRSVKVAGGMAARPVAPFGVHGLAERSPGWRSLERVGAVRLQSEAPLRFRLEPDGCRPAEGYSLRADATGIEVVASTPQGLDHGARTIAQLAKAPDPLPCFTVEDAPDLAPRGAMLDVSRDRVPTMATLRRTIERLADLKITQLQLYVEHTFAYRGHEAVWRHASPLTPDEVRELDAHAAAEGIDLVPNQNAFGHLHRWLRLPEYRHLAEVPEGVEHAFAREREPFGLCPTDPRSLAFVENLFDQLLPCFTSRECNVGLDETIDLGLGRSRERCEAEGTVRVYLDFLRQVHGVVERHGRTMQYWGDIVIASPEVVPELPHDAIALLWGYEAGHPFDANASTFAEHGVPFRVCPGTSSWQSLLGRTDNLRANLAEAAEAATRHGAQGWLVTDWGDFGHWQPLDVGWPGLALGASRGWNASAAVPDLAGALDQNVLEDAPNGTGALLLDLGLAHRALASPARNGTSLFQLLRRPDHALPNEWCPELGAAGIEAYLDHLDGDLLPRLAARPERYAELDVAARITHLAARLGRARLEAGPGAPLSELPLPLRRTFAEELTSLAADQRRLWERTSRPGGADDSAARLRDVTRWLSGTPD